MAASAALEEVGTAKRPQPLAERPTDRHGIATRQSAVVGDAPVRRQNHTVERHPLRPEAGVTGDRRPARTVEHRQERPFGQNRRTGAGVVDRRQQARHRGIIGPAFDAAGLTEAEVNERAEAWIEAEMRKISPHRYKKDAAKAA